MNFKKSAIVIFLHLTIVVSAFIFFYRIGVFNKLPDNMSLLGEDVGWYSGIKKYGYQFNQGARSNIAFFPLFPYFWRYSALTTIGISVFNLLLFVTSMSILMHNRKISSGFLLGLVAIPSFIFVSIPYTEAIFFFFGTLLILGFSRNNNYLITIGLLGCCISRSVSILFIPALIVTEVLVYFHFSHDLKALIKKLTIYCGACIISIGVVVIIQGIQTGMWFHFLSMQKYWGRILHWPSAPFTTISPEKVLGIDGVAVILGAVAGWFCLKWLRILFKNIQPKFESITIPEDRSVLFSALYLAGTAFVDVFFTSQSGGHTNIWSINRHLFCVPFAIYFLVWLHHEYQVLKSDFLFISILILAGCYFTGVAFLFNQMYYYILFCITLFIIPFYPKLRFVTYIMYTLNAFVQIFFYHDFLNHKWIG
ncbi:hypothetical protein ACVWYN_000413 [Pedobacter sp. UYP24]